MSSDADKKKYDRQIRIWGAHGQAKLETARVCLLHAGPTGSETLKNLVLGGIAAFTVVDDARVSTASPNKVTSRKTRSHAVPDCRFRAAPISAFRPSSMSRSNTSILR